MSDAFQGTLLTGERVLWSGRPAQGIVFTPRDIVMIPFSLLWGGFAIFWETMVVTKGVPWFFALWGVPFVLVGLTLIFGRFLIDAYLRSKLHYAITDRRVLIARVAPFEALCSIDLTLPPQMQLVLSGNGRGTIIFGQQMGFARADMGVWVPSLGKTPQFIAIQNPQAVLNMIVGRSATEVRPSDLPALRAVTASSQARLIGVRFAAFALFALSLIGFAAYNSIFCVGSGGAGVHAVRSFATTQASFNVGDRTPATKFGPDDTIMALVVLNWPVSERHGGSHRVVWNWYRGATLIYSTRRCGMNFDSQPFSLWTWRTAREIGGGHVRVDTLIDDRVVGSAGFDVAAPMSSFNQGWLTTQWFCG